MVIEIDAFSESALTLEFITLFSHFKRLVTVNRYGVAVCPVG